MFLQFIVTSDDYIILDLPLNTHMIMRRLGITNFGTNVATFLSQMGNVPAIVLLY
jgi:hypothetical protein